MNPQEEIVKELKAVKQELKVNRRIEVIAAIVYLILVVLLIGSTHYLNKRQEEIRKQLFEEIKRYIPIEGKQVCIEKQGYIPSDRWSF